MHSIPQSVSVTKASVAYRAKGRFDLMLSGEDTTVVITGLSVPRLIFGLTKGMLTASARNAIDMARVWLLIIALALSGASGWRLLKRLNPSKRQSTTP